MGAERQIGTNRPNGPTPSRSSVLSWNDLPIAAWASFHASWFEPLIGMNQEYLAFVNRRLKRDHRLMNELADLSDPTELAAVLANFLETARCDHIDEAQRLTEICVDGTRDVAAAIRSRLAKALAIIQHQAPAVPDTNGEEAR